MMTPEQLFATLPKTASLPAIILCTGDEPMRLLQSIDAIKAKAQHNGFTEQQLMVIEHSSDWELVYLHYQEQSLFATQRLLQLMVYKFNKEAIEWVQKLMAQPNPDVVLLLRCDDMDKKQLSGNWVKQIERMGWLIQSRQLSGQPLQQWLKRQTEEFGLTIDTSALALLATWSEGNLLASWQSLVRWQLQGVTHIDEQRLLTDQQDWAKYDIFALSSTLVQQDAVKSIRILDRLHMAGEEHILLLWAISKELRLWQTLLSVQAQQSWSQLTQEYRLWGSYAEHLKRYLRLLQPIQLAQWQRQCLRLDLLLKGQIVGDFMTELRWLVADVSSLGRCLPKRPLY